MRCAILNKCWLKQKKVAFCEYFFLIPEDKNTNISLYITLNHYKYEYTMDFYFK